MVVRPGERSQGAKLFASLGKTQAALAAALGVSTGIVAMWQSGKRTPSLPNRQAVHELYGIPVVAWDQAPTDDRAPRPASVASRRRRRSDDPRTRAAPSAAEAEILVESTLTSRIDKLEIEADDTIDRLKSDKSVTVLERVKAVESLGKTLIQLRRLRGEDASEVRVLHHPKWIELRTAILDALRAHPDALRAVVSRIGEMSDH